MSEEKKIEQAKQDELTEEQLEKAAGGKTYFGSRSNVVEAPVQPSTQPPSKTGGTNPL
jgi:hypothetical protein